VFPDFNQRLFSIISETNLGISLGTGTSPVDGRPTMISKRIDANASISPFGVHTSLESIRVASALLLCFHKLPRTLVESQQFE
jgi:hypothetical protein